MATAGVKAGTSRMSHVVAIMCHGVTPEITNCSVFYTKDTEANTDHSLGFIVGVQQYQAERPRVCETRDEARVTAASWVSQVPGAWPDMTFESGWFHTWEA